MRTNHDTDRRLGRLAITLAFVGGYVDAVGFVALDHVFTGHVTGNSVLFAIDVAEGTWTTGLHRVVAIVMFVVGMILGWILDQAMLQRETRRRFALTFLLEAVLIGGFIFVGEALGGEASTQAGTPSDAAWKLYTLVGLAATALGLQNAGLRKIGRTVVHTTYITGMATTLSEGTFRRWVRWRERRQPEGSTQTPIDPAPDARLPRRGELLLLFAVILSFAVSAGVGVYVYLGYRLWSLVVPLLILLTLAALDTRRPFSP